MTWRVLISAPYLIPLTEEFRCDWGTDGSLPVFKQVGVIPFRRDFLREFAESIDMLRALEHGRRVHLVETKIDTHAVDTVEDLILVEGLMKEEAALGSIQI